MAVESTQSKEVDNYCFPCSAFGYCSAAAAQFGFKVSCAKPKLQHSDEFDKQIPVKPPIVNKEINSKDHNIDGLSLSYAFRIVSCRMPIGATSCREYISCNIDIE